MTLEEKRKELDKIMNRIPAFTKSTRAKNCYNAKNKQNEKVKVQYDGRNFKVMVGTLETKIQSVPLNKVKMDAVPAYLAQVLTR